MREIMTPVALTPEICAEWFVGAGSDEQVRFLSCAEEGLQSWDSAHLRDVQMIHIAHSADTKGRNFIFRLANWLKAHGLGGEQWDAAIEHYPEVR